MEEVPIPPAPPDRFDALIGPQRAAEFARVLAGARSALDGRTFWHVNSTQQGGGVAEMLQSVLCYLAGAGLEARWLVIDGDASLFEVTKRLHYLLHGHDADGGPLGTAARATYEQALQQDVDAIAGLVRRGDPVVLHDPQTLGLAPALSRGGARVVWTCHIGADAPNAQARDGWRFVAPYLRCTDAQVFSRERYVFEGLDRSHVAVVPPCIDAFSPKNQDLDAATVVAILDRSGIVRGNGSMGRPQFRRFDGAVATISREAVLIEDEPLPPRAPIVTQLSRWDPLKDHLGVMQGFVSHVPASSGAHLVLAGPAPASIADDPSSVETFGALRAGWQLLEPGDRARVHIVCLPMDDVEENAAIVNALQRRSDIVVQKSIAEGFGLTVTEAMWKGRPTVASRVGGIQDQISHGRSGLLIDDPHDVRALGDAVARLLGDPTTAEHLGMAARQRVVDEYLAPCFLTRYLRLAETVGQATDR